MIIFFLIAASLFPLLHCVDSALWRSDQLQVMKIEQHVLLLVG